MRKIILITGGARSGKSSHVLKLGESLPAPRAFVATCRASDDELKHRIRKHRESRNHKLWKTFEEGNNLKGILRSCAKFPVIAVDCLTLWVFNLMCAAESKKKSIHEEEMVQMCTDMLSVCRKQTGAILFVSNEVGLGIVPGDEMSRLYRDLVGVCNKVIAERADEAILMVSGIPVAFKGETR